MVETRNKKQRKRDLLKRWIALCLVLCMMLSDGKLLSIVSYAAERAIAPVPVSIVTSKGDQDSGGSLDGNTDDMPDDLKNDGRVVLLENGKEMRLKLTFNLTAKDGTASNPYLDVQLPYFFTDVTGKLIATYDLADVPVDQRGEKLMGICADVEQDGGYWYDDGSGQTPTEENPPQSQNLQGTIRLIKTGGILSGGTGQVVVLKLRFFGADTPENATGVVNVGGGYSEYTNDKGDSSEMGYYLKPENNKENSYTLVNSNLKWDTTVEQVGQQVLWNQYNYMTYKVTIQNTSDSPNSYFEPFAINFNVPSAAEVNTGQGGILDEDLMAWIYDKKTGAVTENTSVQIGKDEYYTGVPGKGGVLIYDVTDQTDAELAKWDTETYSNVPSDVKEKYYSVTNNRMISFDVDEKMTKGQSKTYYIAVPFTTNFADGLDYKVPTTFWPTIYLDEIKWTKTRTLIAEFSKPKPDFTHEKYVLDDKGKKVEENEIAILGTGTYYISGLENTGNLPVFNPVVTDTLPENYDLNKITIQMDNDSSDASYIPKLSEWFKTDKILEFCFEDTTDPAAEPIWVELGNFGSAVTTDDGREWVLDLNGKIENYLKKNPDYTFTRKMRFNLAERINQGEAFHGRIVVEGVAEKMAVYENKIVTNYTEKIWASKTTGTTDGDPYQNIGKVVEADKATLTTAPAKPIIWTQGYRMKADKTYLYSTPASANDDELAVPLRYNDVGFKYILGNDSISPGIPLEFHSGNLLPFKDDGGNYVNRGLSLEKIVLSKKLLESATIDYIEISNLSGSSKKISGTSLPSVDADGNCVIKNNSWTDKVKNAAYVTIIFKEFKEEVALSERDGAYILLDGSTNRVGHIEVEGSFETKYNDPKYDSVATNTAILNASAINPIMDAVSYDNKGNVSSPINNGVYATITESMPKGLIVPKNMDDAGYIFHLSNGSESGAAETNLWIDFTNTGVKNTTTPSVVKGFIVNDITFSKELDQVGKIEKILFYDYNQEPKDISKTSTPIYTLNWADVTPQSDGSYKITDALWNKLGATRIKTIQIVFEEVYGQSDKDHPEKLEIKVNGNTDQWGNLDALMTFDPLDETMTDKKMNVTGRLTVESAALSVHSNIIYYDVTEAKHATPSGSAKSTDGYQTRLGIPYDRDFRYRVSIENEAISVLDEVDMTIKLPTIATRGADKDNGFHLTKVLLKKELIEQFEEFKSITFVGQDGSTEKTYVYDVDAKTFYIEESGLKKELPKLGDDWVFTEKDIDVSVLETLVFNGKRVKVADDTTEDAWIDFYGYSDGEFETECMIEVDSEHYQDGIREAVHTFATHDSSIMYVSKMYFDTVLAAGYKDTENVINTNAEATRFDKISTALEHMRIGYQCSHWGVTCFWGENAGGSQAKDNSELDIGYKAIGSFMLDFRQYLNVGTNYPNDYSHPHYESIAWQEHEDKNWIKTQSFNTKANVEMKMDIPSEYFDAYYVKVRPDTLSYLKSIVVTYKDGSTATYTSEYWYRYQSSVETYKGEQYVVIPVAKQQDGTYTKYRSPYGVGEDAYKTENPVTNVVFNVDINEKASDDDRSANNPDFGSGFNAQNESTKYMFEVTGRFYRTDDINQKAEASVSTELKIGGTTRGDVTSKERTSKASDADVTSSKNRSYWSYWNKYNYYLSNREDYDAGHLVSTVRVNVENDNNMVLKGVHNDPTVDYDDEVEFGTKNYYSIAYFRTHGTIHGDYKGGKDAKWDHEDLDDWSGKLSFVDQLCLEDTLPPIGYYGETSDYHGFRTEDILFSQKLYKYLDYVEFTLSNGTKVTIAKADLKWNSTKKYYEVLLRYKKLNESVTAGSKNEIELNEKVFLSSYKAYLKDIPGSADYARELLGTDLEVVDNHGGTSNVAANDYLDKESGEISKHNGSDSEIDIKVGGYVHTIKEVDRDEMGTNKVVASYKTDNMTRWENRYRYFKNSNSGDDHGGETFKISENTGRLMGYRIPFSAGWRVDKLVNGSVDNGSVEYDYEADNITPNETSFGVTIWNCPDGSTGKTQSARMKSGTVTTTLPAAYNLKRINIPKELVDGSWFHVSGITLNYNGQSKTFSGADLTNALKREGDNYYLDVNAFEIENKTQFATYTCANTTETYVNEHITSFVMVYEAVNPDVKDNASLLDGGQYISKDKAKGYAFTYDGVWVDRSEADLTSDVYNVNSRPTFGMAQNPNSNVKMTNSTNITFVPADANAEDKLQESYGPSGEKPEESINYNAKNLIGQMVVRVDRGETSRFAYDRVTASDGTTSEYAVDKDYLLPYDYVNYTLTAGASADSPIPLQHTDLQFVVPKGQRIVGWEIKSNTITSVADTEIVVTVENGSTTVTLDPNTYYVKEDEVDTNYKELYITLGANKGTMDGDMIKAGEKVEIIVYTQFLDEFGSTANPVAFENQPIVAKYYASSTPKHTYSQYGIFAQDSSGNKKDTWSGHVSSAYEYRYYEEEYNTKSEVDYYRYDIKENAVDGKPAMETYTSEVRSKLTIRNVQDDLKLEYIYTDELSQYDRQGMQIKVNNNGNGGKKTDVTNDTRHELDEITFEVSFLSQHNKSDNTERWFKSFELTKKPTFYYPENNDRDNAGSVVPDEDIEYLVEVDGEEVWIKSDKIKEGEVTEQEAADGWHSVTEARKVRWTYYDISAMGTDGEEVLFASEDNPFLFEGLGLYNNIRENKKTKIADRYDMKLDATATAVHTHRDDRNDSEHVLNFKGTGNITTVIARERPILTYQTQIFGSEGEARTPYQYDAKQKNGYRPGDEMWYKVTVKNNKLTTEADAKKDMQGALLDPVFYDKIPEYVTPDMSTIQIRWLAADGSTKTSDKSIMSITKTQMDAADYGGDMITAKNTFASGADGALDNKNNVRYDDIVPNDSNSTEISYDVYQINFADGTRLEVGEQIEIWYMVEVKTENLPINYVKDSDGNIYPEYYPKIGSWDQWALDYYGANGISWPLGNLGRSYQEGDGDGCIRSIDTSNIMMDMSYLIHDVGISGTLNKDVDRWEFLNDSTTYIPGSATNVATYYTWTARIYGDNNRYFDEDSASYSVWQKTTYRADITGEDLDILPTSTKYLGVNDKDRDLYKMVVKPRTDVTKTAWDNKTDEDHVPILWSEARSHLQTAWIATSSEIIPDHDATDTNEILYSNHAKQYLKNAYTTYTGYNLTNPLYGMYISSDYGQNARQDLFADDCIPTLEYDEEFTTRLSAYNYGDWSVDGVEFIYVLPRGISPVKENGNFIVTGTTLTGGDSRKEELSYISAGNIDVEVLQTPTGKQNYLSPKSVQDPILSDPKWNTTGDEYDEQYYTEEDSESWVLKITVRQPLKKWFNRGTDKGYILHVDVRCHVDSTNESEYWYDKVFTRPIETDGGNDSAYYQIYDITSWDGNTKEKATQSRGSLSTQYAGMDYLWDGYDNANSVDGATAYKHGSPNTPYINGFNIQNHEVVTEANVNGEIVTGAFDHAKGIKSDMQYDYYSSGKTTAYASTGTRAQMRKPMLRTWTTMGDDLGENWEGRLLEQYYTNVEGEQSAINIHVENKYYWDELATNGHSAMSGTGNNDGNSTIKHLHNYSTDGGNEGTFFFPVVTNILPAGTVPMYKVEENGKVIYRTFTTDNVENAKHTVDWILYDKSGVALPDEQSLYTAKVEYVEITNDDGVKEGRYKVVFWQDQNTKDVKEDAKIVSGDKRIFSFRMVTVAEPDMNLKDGTTASDLLKQYQTNRVYVTSQLEGFKFKIDSDVNGNPYYVGAKWSPYYASKYDVGDDVRTDSILNTVNHPGISNTKDTRGVLPNSNITILKNLVNGSNGVTYSISDAVQTNGVRRYYESGEQIKEGEETGSQTADDILNAEDYTEIRSGLPLDRNGLQTDFNMSGSTTHVDAVSDGECSDSGVYTSMRIRTQSPCINVDAKVSQELEEENPKDGLSNTATKGVTHYPTTGFDNEDYVKSDRDHKQYGDELYYTAVISNNPDKTTAPEVYEQKGDVLHSKIILSMELPSLVSYEGTAYLETMIGGKLQRIKVTDSDTEVTDPDTEVTDSDTEGKSFDTVGNQVSVDAKEDVADMAGLKTTKHHTWQIKLRSHEVDENTERETLVFEIITPNSSGEKNGQITYEEFLQGEHLNGYFASGDKFNFKVKTVIDNLGSEDSVLDTPDYWDEEYYADMYVSLEDTDGSYLEQTVSDKLSKQSLDKALFINEKEDCPRTDTDPEVDHDLDKNYKERHASDRTARVTILKPSATVRLDTEIKRIQLSNPDAGIIIAEDASIKGATVSKIYLDQAVNTGGAVGEFIVDYRLPHRGTTSGTIYEAPTSAPSLETTVYKIRTGVWEIPESVKQEKGSDYYNELKKNLRVSVYVMCDDTPENKAYDKPGSEDYKSESWIKLTDDYALDENAVIDIKSIKEDYMTEICQIRFVIRSSDDVDVTKKYPVPQGFRLDIDANMNGTTDPVTGDVTYEAPGDQEMDEVDPTRANVEWPADKKKENNVAENAAFVEISMRQKENASMKLHANNFATVWGRYDDTKYAALSEQARAGYFINVELPVIQKDLKPWYFNGSYGKFSWSDTKLLVDPSNSKMLRYTSVLKNLSESQIAEAGLNEDPDYATNPTISVVLPYLQAIDDDYYAYVDAYSADYTDPEKCFVNEEYTANASLNAKKAQWSFKIVDEEGNQVSRRNITDVQFSTYEKMVDLSGNARKVLTWNFTGYLNPGESIVVEYMVPISAKDYALVSNDLMTCSSHGYLQGSFKQYIPESMNSSETYSVEVDARDINNNGKTISETALIKRVGGIGFATAQKVDRSKYAYSEYDTAGLQETRPALVPEGTNYKFKVSAINPDTAGNIGFKKTILYDVLPHIGDSMITLDLERNSKWSGWVLPDTIKVVRTAPSTSGLVTTEMVDGTDCEIWVGPFAKENGKIVTISVEDLPELAQTSVSQFYEDAYVNKDGIKEKYFVKLSEILALEKTNPDTYLALSKNIMAIWAQIADEDELRLDGSSKYELEYSLHSPLNLPQYPGAITSDMNDDTIRQSVAEYTGWNTYASHATEALSGEEKNMLNESIKAGVYLNAPVEKGYIGSYIWLDENYNAVIDEAAYERRSDGRLLYKNATKDLDHDGQMDDPGINGVKVELLTENGYPANKLGQAVVEVQENGVTKYIVIDETTGLKAKDATGTYLYTTEGAATYTTEADAYGNNGYFIISNITPGNYKLRYTLPNGTYNQYAVTTLESGAIGTTGENLNASKTKMDIYRPGDTLPDLGKTGTGDVTSDAMAITDNLVVQTHDSIRIDAVGTDTSKYAAYDERMTSYNLGVSRSYIYGGYAWVDETTDAEGNIISDGIYDTTKEMPLENVEVKFYEVVDGQLKEAYDVNGDVAECMTNAEGYFEIYLYPNRTYVARTNTSKNTTGIYKPSPVTINTDPLLADNDNDLTQTADKSQETFLIHTGILYDTSGNPITTTDDKDYNYGIYDRIGLGYVQAGRGFIGKYVWNDKNYDGIRGSYTENGVTISEPGIENVELVLEKHYYDADSNEWKSTGEEVTVKSNSGGSYTFQNVSTYHTVEDPTTGDSKIYLAGYKVKVDLAKLPNADKYAITKYQSNGGVDDSDLPVKTLPNTGFSYLTASAKDLDSTGEYMILAEKKNASTKAENIYKDQAGTEYDVTDAKMILDVDLGLTEKEDAMISGKIWFDANYDGLLDTAEEGIKDVALSLQQYYLDKDGNWNLVPDWTISVSTSETGDYSFNNLKAQVIVNGEYYLAGYRVVVDPESEPDKTRYGITKYQVGTGDERDSDLSNDYEIYHGAYIILASPENGTATSNPYTQMFDGICYDYIKAVNNPNNDGGFAIYNSAVIEGTVFEDVDYDGLLDSDEGYANILADLNGEELIITKETYYYGPKDSYHDDEVMPADLESTEDEDDDTAWAWQPYKVHDEDGYAHHATETKIVNQDGTYKFENVPTQVTINGKHYLAGYKLRISKIPDGYGTTLYLANNGVKDSALYYESKNNVLDITKTHPSNGYTGTDFEEVDGYLIPAKPVTGNHTGDYAVVAVGGQEFDLLGSRDLTNYNAGYHVAGEGKIVGTVFHDKDYDGIYEVDSETGINDITVYLDQYYLTEDGWQKVELPEGKRAFAESVTSSVDGKDGIFVFENLSTKVSIDGKAYLASYRIHIDEIPEEYVVTKLNQRTGEGEALDETRDSDMVAETGDLIFGDGSDPLDGYIMIAKQLTDGDIRNEEYICEYNGMEFDLQASVGVNDYDAGLTNYQSGSIGGTIWLDTNEDCELSYNGIQDEGEEGIEGQNVILTQYVYKEGLLGGRWEKVEDFGTDGRMETLTDENGNYLFDNLPLFRVNEDGDRELFSYQLQVEELMEGYAVTKYRQGEDRNVDSDLNAETLELTDAKEFIILANDVTEDSYRNEMYVEAVKIGLLGETRYYDIVDGTEHTEYDGGYAVYPMGSISGIAFEDKNANGIYEKKNDKLKAGVTIYLKKYYYDSETKEWDSIDSGLDASTKTDKNGLYHFDNLPTYEKIGEKWYLCGYKLWLKEMPAGYEATEYLKNKGKDDSALAGKSLMITKRGVRFTEVMDEFIIVARNNKDEKDKNLYNTIGNYDIAAAVKLTDYNVGFKTAEKVVQTGDQNHLMLWFVILMMSGVTIVSVGVYRRRKKVRK